MDRSITRRLAPSFLACAGAAAMLTFTAVPARAENPDGCRAKIERAEARYDAAVYRFGRDSALADKKRYKVNSVRAYCYRLFGEGWDSRGSRWHREHW